MHSVEIKWVVKEVPNGRKAHTAITPTSLSGQSWDESLLKIPFTQVECWGRASPAVKDNEVNPPGIGYELGWARCQLEKHYWY